MTTHPSETSTGRALRPPRAGRSNGQWAVDGREPLNANEAWKQEDGGLNVRERIEQVYAKEGFASIPPEDLSGRFRWWGLYTQRKPGIDGGRTAQLDDTELSDEYFMLRVRLDGGALTLAPAAGARRPQPRLRPGHRRHQRPAEHPVPLDPRRGRARDLAPPRGGRPADHRGLRRHPARHPRQPAGRHRGRRDHRPDADHRRDHPPLRRRPRAGQPPPQVQVGDHRAPQPRRRPRDQRHLARRCRAPRAGRRLRPLGRRRAVHGPAPGRADRRLRRAGAGRRRVARRHLDLPRLRLPAAAHQGPPEVPHGRVGRREVPPGARDRVPRPRRCPTALPRRPRPAPATTSACTCRRTATTTSARPRSSAGSAATCSPGSPT